MKLTKENFAKTIRDIREKKKLSRKELAEKLNLSSRTVEGWENGKPPAKWLIEFFNFMTKQKG